MISFFGLMLPALLFPSLLAALGASIAGGVVGSYIVVKRIVSITGSISHSILGGIGLTLWMQYQLNLEFSPMYGAIVGAVIIAICIGKVHLKYQEREDALIGMIWSVGMAIGIIFISQLPAFNSELINFLFGNILWVTTHDIYSLGVLDVVVLTTVVLCHTRFLALCFDEKYMMLSRYSVQTWYLLLLILTAITIVMLIYIMGVILTLSMLVLPISIACRFSYRMAHIMIISVFLNVLCSCSGIVVAYALDFPAGPTIAILMGLAYMASLFVKRLFSKSTPSPVNPDSNTNFSEGNSL
ncbi:ABC transporter of metals [Chlamydia felis Fe/C-56]|uniref:ABC transporter of metals n=1 Tax=Chlamydia felis (strain Fe/C-56) TaxID=264202 RepID=Q253F9_CHLFF|nr:metal ABC transporter permease [Chlamydia felis]BAE81579.1 ABC transporter of metals [Chlamydia felis Fe/C-56]